MKKATPKVPLNEALFEASSACTDLYEAVMKMTEALDKISKLTKLSRYSYEVK